MSIDLNNLSAKELEALIAQAKKRKTLLGKRKPIATVRQKLTALARAEGYTIAELFGGAAPAAPRAAKSATGKSHPSKGRKLGKVAAKYHNPANPAGFQRPTVSNLRGFPQIQNAPALPHLPTASPPLPDQPAVK